MDEACKEMVSPAEAWRCSLDERFAATIAGVREAILGSYPDTLALMVVGSVAEGVQDGFSDVDFVYVREPKIPNERIIAIRKAWPLAQFIVMSREGLRKDFELGTVAAWSISRGKVLHDPDQVLEPFVGRTPQLPSRTWLIERRDKVAKWPSDVEGLWKKTFNLAVLVLAQQGVVATTKHQLREQFPHCVSDPLLRRAVDAVCVRGESARLQRCAEEVELLEGAVERMLQMIDGTTS